MNFLDRLRSVLGRRQHNGDAEVVLDKVEQRSDAVLVHADRALRESALVKSAREMDDRLARRGR